MKDALTRFTVKNLYGKDIDVPIEDNKLILVGENGTGKSAILNLIYCFMSGNWGQMRCINFDFIEATIGNKTLKIERSDLWEKVYKDKVDQLLAEITSKIVFLPATFSHFDQSHFPQPRNSDFIHRTKEDLEPFLLCLLSKFYLTEPEIIYKVIAACNEYFLPNKKLVYNEKTNKLSVKYCGKEEIADMTILCLTEALIVKLFFILYLETNCQSFVIIDEPETSLSVFWQERLLPDILKTGMCSGLIAATHSPFIYDNELSKYTHSIEKFTKETIFK